MSLFALLLQHRISTEKRDLRVFLEFARVWYLLLTPLSVPSDLSPISQFGKARQFFNNLWKTSSTKVHKCVKCIKVCDWLQYRKLMNVTIFHINRGLPLQGPATKRVWCILPVSSNVRRDSECMSIRRHVTLASTFTQTRLYWLTYSTVMPKTGLTFINSPSSNKLSKTFARSFNLNTLVTRFQITRIVQNFKNVRFVMVLRCFPGATGNCLL